MFCIHQVDGSTAQYTSKLSSDADFTRKSLRSGVAVQADAPDEVAAGVGVTDGAALADGPALTDADGSSVGVGAAVGVGVVVGSGVAAADSVATGLGVT
jgi:hypothetical protein